MKKSFHFFIFSESKSNRTPRCYRWTESQPEAPRARSGNLLRVSFNIHLKYKKKSIQLHSVIGM